MIAYTTARESTPLVHSGDACCLYRLLDALWGVECTLAVIGTGGPRRKGAEQSFGRGVRYRYTRSGHQSQKGK
eukprot:6016928-Pyramimonas_sp.AAC.1